MKPGRRRTAGPSADVEIPSDRDEARLELAGAIVRLTNLRKPFWPDRGLTKGDLLRYYARVAPVLLPHLRDRAMVMKRYPNGVSGKFFFMKRAPRPRPEWIQVCSIEHASGNVIDFPVVQDLASLLWVVNLGCIDLNQWYAPCDDVDRPDSLHFDLDPTPGASFDQVRETALVLRRALEHVGMRPCAKTSGSKGMHVYVPIERGPLQKEVWTIAKEIAGVVAAAHPELVTAEYAIARRPPRRVLIDYNQNAWGRTLASVYSVRPTPQATVSTPLRWQEVEKGVATEDFGMEEVLARVRRFGDLWKPLLERRGRFRLERLRDPAPENPRSPRPRRSGSGSTDDGGLRPPLAPMEAASAESLPIERGKWLYEPKWDGFRCVAFRRGDRVDLQSKAGQPLARYFPEVVECLRRLEVPRFVLDGEIVVPADGGFSFDDLLQRIHPAESRVRKLAAERPASLVAFDLLADEEDPSLVALPLAERRRRLEAFAAAHFAPQGCLRLSPATTHPAAARRWLETTDSLHDGVVAKRLDMPYRSGERDGACKVKRLRTADCVVGGFRYAARERILGSLLLGLYGADGLLHHVGFCSALDRATRRELTPRLEKLVRPPGFTGRAPGGPSRWSRGRSVDWQPLAPKLVVEVGFDHVTADRFRHGTRFLRWRPDKRPDQCGMEQLAAKAVSASPGAA